MSLISEWTNATDAAIDAKLGLVAIKLPFTVSPGATKIATLLHALTFFPPELAEISLPMIKRNLKERPDCGYDVTFEFEGHFNPKDADGEEFSLDGSTSDDPIESHPEIEMLVSKYFPEGTTLKSARKTDSGDIVFPPTIKDINGEDTPNPLYGTRNYLVPGMIWTRSFVTQDFPTGLARQLGCIGTPPIGNLGQRPPSLEGTRDWIMIRLKADWRGNVWKVSESWQVTGRNGAAPDVYRYK